MPRGLFGVALIAWASIGCGRLGFDPLADGGTTPPDAAIDDAALADGGMPLDAGDLDASMRDGGTMMRDGGMMRRDSGPRDPDTGTSDAGTSDAGACAYAMARVVTAIDTPDGEYQVTVSRDGRTLCFARDVAGTIGLWCSTHEPGGWEPPREQTMVNVPSAVSRMPALSDDGATLYFSSNRGGGAGGYDIWVATWSPMTEAFTGPTNLAAVNTSADEGGPELSPDQRSLYFDRGSAGASRMFVSTRAGATSAFGAPTMVSGVMAGDSEIGIAPDGTHVVLCTNRSTAGVGMGHTSLWCGTLSGSTVSGVVAVSAPNMDGACSPAFGAVGELYFNVLGFPGGPGGSDVVTSP